ncbi:cystathionine beta-lyase [Novosphingobium profundi]|uniref:cystathionine beta-lyase n=1 Tax=Novosphingobium profundi TaxID=1774954 RepID=UPI0031B9DB81
MRDTPSTTSTSEATRLIHPQGDAKAPVRTAAPVLQRGTTVLHACAASFGQTLPSYGRSGLATHGELRQALCDLEGGDVAELYPSGLAALAGAILAVCRTGDEILMCDTIYGPTRRFAETTMADYGVTTRPFPASASAEELEAMLGEKTRLIVLESPGSLTLDMIDVPAIAAMARRRGVLTLIDNTYAAGLLFKPLAHGVDISVQAMTKYICGHSDVFMGCAVARGEVGALLQRGTRAIGWTISSDDAYLALRGMKTLELRLAQHGAAALEVARWLSARPEVKSVLCPALPGAPGHEIFARDFSGGNGLVTIELDGPLAATPAFLDALSIFGLGFSWGGFESLAIACNDQLEARAFEREWTRPVIRLHIGLETTGDLIAELDGALGAFAKAAQTLSGVPA